MEGRSVPTLAIVLAVEDYQFADRGMKKVHYAERDARAFASALVERFGMKPENVKLWINSDVSMARIDNDVRYRVENLAEDDFFVFYYAGHGFFRDGHNLLTTWDTVPEKIPAGCFSVKDTILKHVDKCAKSLLFIDACSERLADSLKSRDVLSSLSEREFREFLKSDRFHSTFLASSPGEKSFPSEHLAHGIWTWHVLEAFSGKVPEALIQGQSLTDTSLRDYLSHSVPKYVREKLDTMKSQNPLAVVSANRSFEILHFKKDLMPQSKLAELNPDFSSAYVFHAHKFDFDNLPGYSKKRGHFVPEKYSHASNQFCKTSMAEEVSEELKSFYQRLKDELKYSRDDLNRNIGEGEGSLDSDQFRYEITTGQSGATPSSAYVKRILRLRAKATRQFLDQLEEVLPEDFSPKTLLIPLKNEPKDPSFFDGLVRNFEQRFKPKGWRVVEDEDDETVRVEASDGRVLTVDLRNKRLLLNFGRHKATDVFTALLNPADSFRDLLEETETIADEVGPDEEKR